MHGTAYKLVKSTEIKCTAMNEKTWERVAEWERLHSNECPDPRLLRFMGRPDDLRLASRPRQQT